MSAKNSPVKNDVEVHHSRTQSNESNTSNRSDNRSKQHCICCGTKLKAEVYRTCPHGERVECEHFQQNILNRYVCDDTKRMKNKLSYNRNLDNRKRKYDLKKKQFKKTLLKPWIKTINRRRPCYGDYLQPSISTITSTKITGVLNELKDDIDHFNTPCNSVEFTSSLPSVATGATSGLQDVYIEHNGKFIKAPKEVLDNNNYYTKEVYLEQLGCICSTPLDIAITVEKIWSTISRMLLGILAGISLLKLLLILCSEDLFTDLSFISYLTEISTICFMVILPFSLVSIFDWLDLAHCNPQHLAESIQYRKIVIVILIYTGVFILFLLSSPYNDFVIVVNNDDTTFEKDPDGRDKLTSWKFYWIFITIFSILGWIIVTATRNEDLLYIHLIEMKKFEDNQEITFENSCSFSIK